MKKILFLVVLINLSNFGSAHTDGDTVQYSMVINKPNTPYFGIGASYGLSVNSYNMTLAAFGFDATYLNEFFSVNLYSRFHLGERVADFSGNEPYATSMYEPKHSRDLGFLATYYFINDIKHGNRVIRLGGNNRQEIITEVPCDYSQRFGVDLGFSAGVTYYNFQEDESIDVLDMTGNAIVIGNNNERSIASYYKYSFMKVGVNWTILNQVTIQTDKFGRRSDNSTSTIYLHAFVGLNGALDDIYYPPNFMDPETGPFSQYSLSPVGFNRLGGCIGWSTYGLKKMGIGTVLECGLLPGPKTAIVNNLYLDLKLRFHIANYL